MNLLQTKRRQSSSVHSMRLLGVLCLFTVVFIPIALRAAPPSWWAARGVTDSTKQANDFAAVNQGQLKYIATQAMQEMETHLPGGAGDAVATLTASWISPTAQSNDYAPRQFRHVKNGCSALL